MAQSPGWTQQLRLEAGVSGSTEGFQEGFQAFLPKYFQQHNLNQQFPVQAVMVVPQLPGQQQTISQDQT